MDDHGDFGFFESSADHEFARLVEGRLVGGVSGEVPLRLLAAEALDEITADLPYGAYSFIATGFSGIRASCHALVGAFQAREGACGRVGWTAAVYSVVHPSSSVAGVVLWAAPQHLDFAAKATVSEIAIDGEEGSGAPIGRILPGGGVVVRKRRGRDQVLMERVYV